MDIVDIQISIDIAVTVPIGRVHKNVIRILEFRRKHVMKLPRFRPETTIVDVVEILSLDKGKQVCAGEYMM